MDKIKVIYFSNSGNTEEMAKAIADGVTSAGKEAVLLAADGIDASEVSDEAAFAMGCPACGDEELDDTVMQDFVESLSDKVKGKTILLFGSHDWGEGDWMKNWVDQMKSYGAKILGDEGIICTLEPDDEAKAKLNEAGKALAAL